MLPGAGQLAASRQKEVKELYIIHVSHRTKNHVDLWYSQFQTFTSK